jgi:hypothetical protein
VGFDDFARSVSSYSQLRGCLCQDNQVLARCKDRKSLRCPGVNWPCRCVSLWPVLTAVLLVVADVVTKVAWYLFSSVHFACVCHRVCLCFTLGVWDFSIAVFGVVWGGEFWKDKGQKGIFNDFDSAD